MLYNMKYIFALLPDPGTELLEPLNFDKSHNGEKSLLLFITETFQVQRSLCDEVIWGKHSDSHSVGAGCQRNQPRDEKIATFSSSSKPPGRIEELEVELITNGQLFNQSYVIKLT